MTGPARMRDVVVIGGGCYGTFYGSQLEKARARGKAAYRRVLIVDRDAQCRARTELGPARDRVLVTREWDAFLEEFLPAAGPGDYLVPSPHMPHLMFEWIVRRARARWPGRDVAVVPVPGALGTPYDRSAADATRYVSFADWICPTHCVEPAVCPAIGSRRTWEMGEAVAGLTQRLRFAGHPVHGPALFVCRHHVFGVGTFPIAAVQDGDRLVAEAGAAGDAAEVLVGTISSCHGAVNLLRLGAETRA
jgi:hypothetical protein